MARGQCWLTAWKGRRCERAKRAASLEQLRPLSHWQRLVRIAATFAAVVAICGFLDLGGGLQHSEQYVYNLRQSVFAARHEDLAGRAWKQIVLVPISDETLKRFRLPAPPLPRRYHAKVISELTRAGARVIALDLTLFTPSPDDAVLAAAARASGRVLWACYCESEHTSQQRMVFPAAHLRQAGAPMGHIHVSSDTESGEVDLVEAVKTRGMRPVKQEGQFMPAFSVKAVMMARGMNNPPVKRIPEAWRVGDLAIPVNREGYFNISYFRKRDKPLYLQLPYEDLYDGVATEGDSVAVYREILRDKIVIIGDTTTLSDDNYPTPVGTMPGMELHAHAMATLLERQFVRVVPWWVNFAVLCLLAAMVCPLAALWRLLWAALATVGLLVGYFLFNVWLFVDHGIWLHLVGPSAAVFLTTVGLLIERDLTEEREKNRYRALLRRYLSPQTAEYVITHPEKCLLGGDRVTATVLFADIRGFTTVMEKLPRERVVVYLNEYFQAMTEITFQHDGAVDKYMGDNVMALFGVLVPVPDHARRAVAAAIDMKRVMERIQVKWQMQGLPPLEIDIGINTGDMVVGNMGANERWDFTVVGDVVNLASRVEGLNRELGTHILITASTFEYVRDTVDTCGPLTVRVRGKEDPVVLYEVLGWREAPEDATPHEGSLSILATV